MAYLRKMRAEQMARLLVCLELSIAKVARTVGRRNVPSRLQPSSAVSTGEVALEAADGHGNLASGQQPWAERAGAALTESGKGPQRSPELR